MTMTLYHCINARSFRVLWMLEELGLPYELKVLPFPPRSRDEQYLEVNPLGTIPAFLDGDVWMSESAAICQYLAARHSPHTARQFRITKSPGSTWVTPAPTDSTVPAASCPSRNGYSSLMPPSR